MALNDPILTRIVIQRNQSLSGRGLTGFLVLGGLPSLVFIAFAVFGGWWPIVGFCAGVFVLVAVTLYVVMAAAKEREVVTVTAQDLIVESGRHGPRMRVKLDRYWARVEAHVESHESSSTALTLTSRGVAVEIAAALPAAERKQLARRLAALIGPGAQPWDATVSSCNDIASTGCSKS